MTREQFIRKWLGNRASYAEHNRDLMRDDLDEVIEYRALRQPDVIESVCSCGKRKSYNKRNKWWCWYCNREKKKQTDPPMKMEQEQIIKE